MRCVVKDKNKVLIEFIQICNIEIVNFSTKDNDSDSCSWIITNYCYNHYFITGST